MENSILVPLGVTDINQSLVRVAEAWGQRTNATLYFLHVHSEQALGTVEQSRLRYTSFLHSCDIKASHEILFEVGKPYHHILEASQKYQVRLIIMAAHNHTAIERVLTGSNTNYAMHHAQCSLYIHRESEHVFSNKILVPLDYSELNKSLVRKADELVQKTHNELHFVHVKKNVEFHFAQKDDGTWNYEEFDPEQLKEETDRANKELHAFVDPLNIRSSYQTHILFGDKPYYKILDLQRELKAEFIMLASHEHSSVRRIFLGSNTEYVVHHADCPVYICKSLD